MRLISAICTPLDDDGRLHVEGLRLHLEEQWQGGIDGVLIGGTMGLLQLLADETWRALVQEGADEEAWLAQKRLVREEGIFAEPAGAVGVAGAVAAAGRGEIGPRDTVVCLITGTGFKDVAAVERMTAADACPTVGWDDLA